MSINLTFLWHMHQPDYQNDGIMQMPWVFLHSIKDYYDMPWILSKYPNLKATFNITPPLIEQMELYIKYGVSRDKFLHLISLPLFHLGSSEREYIINICNSAQYDTMVKPLPRFEQLYKKSNYSDKELDELIVLFLLSWCGNYLRQEPYIANLIEQNGNYSHTQKIELIEYLISFIPKILPLYKDMQNSNQIEVSTTPKNHPILPLLVSMDNAIKANPNTTTPANAIPLVEDAKLQVREAIELYSKYFDKNPCGMWPAEGAVSEDTIGIYQNFGIEWIATDEAILFASLDDNSRDRLYQRYSYKGLSIAFRDHKLSDLIGFEYRYKLPQDASNDFIWQLSQIDNSKNRDVVVILDGENAWEFYQNNGYDFFCSLYEKLSSIDWCNCITMSQRAKLDSISLEKLTSGSWIYGNFDTWVGNEQKNEAWRLLFETQISYKRFKDKLSQEVQNRIEKHLLVAECSDWFWWYGDDHYTKFADSFDRLFRGHLINVYKLLSLSVPTVLYQPITANRANNDVIVYPKCYISPTIDGKMSSFYEWLGSGMVDEEKLYSTMDRVRGPVKRLYWGSDKSKQYIYLRFDGNMEWLIKTKLLILDRLNNQTLTVDFTNPYKIKGLTVAIGTIAELSISTALLNLKDKISLSIEIIEDEVTIQTLPGVGTISIDINENYANNWFV